MASSRSWAYSMVGVASIALVAVAYASRAKCTVERQDGERSASYVEMADAAVV